MSAKFRIKSVMGLLIPIIAILLVCCACRQPDAEGTPTLVVFLNMQRAGADDLEQVNAALDAYVVEKLGFHVRLQVPSPYSQAFTTAMQRGEQIDIAYCPTLSSVYQMEKDGWLSPLDGLLEEAGSGILSALDPDYYEFSRLNGRLYAIPTNRDRYEVTGFEYNLEIAEQYHLNLSDVTSMEDLTGVFAALKEAAPDIAPTVVVPGTLRYEHVDTLGDRYGVLTRDSGSNIVNLYETEEFERLVALLHDWKQKGYLLDYMRDAGSVVFYLRSGQVFGCLTHGNAGFEAQETKLCRRDIGFLPFSAPYRSSANQSLAWYVIPTTSPDPGQAMRLLNLMYSDPYVANLIMYGVEGVHYRRDASNPQILHYMDGLASIPYSGPTGWSYCNQYIADIWEGYDADMWEKTEATNRTAIRSPAWGFYFDGAPVAEQIYRCDRVCNEYLYSLYAGIADPAETAAAFQRELKTAGIDEIIAEKQRQLDLFLTIQNRD